MQGCPVLLLLSNLAVEVLATTKRRKKEKKKGRKQGRKEFRKKGKRKERYLDSKGRNRTLELFIGRNCM